MRTGRILVVDDDPDILETIRFSLEKDGHEVNTAGDGPSAARRLAMERYDVLLADLMMPGMTGSELIRKSLKRDPRIVCVIMTAYGSFNTAVKVMKEGAFDFIEKPLNLQALSLLVTRGLAHRQLITENLALRNAVELHQLSLPVCTPLELAAVLDRIIDKTQQEIRSEHVYLLLRPDERAEFVLCGARGVAAETPLGTLLHADACMGGEVLNTAKPLLVETRKSWSGPKASALGEDLFVSSLLVPLKLNNRVIGVLGVGSPDLDRSFSPGDEEALTILAAYAAVGIENARRHDEVKRRDLEVVIGFSHALVSKDPGLRGHPERVAVLSKIVAKEMGLDLATCDEIYYGGLLSDLGRIGVPGSIRPASSGPGNGEPAEIRRVPLIGKEIHRPSPDLGSVADIVYTYHERYDGEGREGLRGEQIPIGARIVAVAVALDELTSGGSHAPAMDLEAALESLREGAGTRFDPGVVSAFERALGDSQVSVSLDGRVGRS